MKYLITGGCGFLGSNLSQRVLKEGHQLVVFDNLYRDGAARNLDWLKSLGEFEFVSGDIRSATDVDYVVEKSRPDIVFHVAGQVAMTTSLQRPRFDFEVNALGSINLLEALRAYAPEAAVIFSSTNKVYGDLEYLEYEEDETRYRIKDHPNGLNESIGLDFSTPYGCSKGYADQCMLDYYKNYGIRSVVFRHSSIYGGRQFSTADQGWIGWFVQQALEAKAGNGRRFTISGSGKQVRDVLYSSDLVECYFAAVENISQAAGQEFNIGGGQENSLSLLELLNYLGKTLDVELDYEKIAVRKSDQKVFVADITKAAERIQWRPKVSKEQGLQEMINWVREL